MHIRSATRGSALALWQTRHVAALVHETDSSVVFDEVVVSTVGDRRTDVPIHSMGGKGIFVKEVQAAVLDGRADIAVHSGKDMPAVSPDGLVLAAVPERADARDALVGCRFDDLPTGARIGTGSVRRRAQLAWHRPDLVFSEIRGNIATRLGKAADFDAIVMASAAIDRLGEFPAVVDRLDPSILLPQVAQGALTIECRADDTNIRALLAMIEHRPSRRVVDAERAFLAELGGDCSLPAGAHAVLTNRPVVPAEKSGDAGKGRHAGDREIELTGMLSTLDGRVLIRETRRGFNPDDLGRSVARYLLDDCGGADLLSDLR